MRIAKYKSIDRTCQGCGKHFKADNENNVYCSFICRNKNRNDKDRKRTVVEYICFNCNKVFFDRRRKRRENRQHNFCCRKCYYEWYRYDKLQMKQYVCQICGKEFYRLPGNSNPNMYCSKRCQLISVGSKHRPYTEEVFETLLKNNNIEYEIQYKYTKYFADFYIPSFNLLLELDGKTFHSSDIAIKKDKLKGNTSSKCGFNMIRVWCSRKKQVEKLKGNDLAEVISAIPKGMINSVNLL